MVIAAFVSNIVSAYWLYYYQRRVKNSFMKSLLLAIGCGNFIGAVALGTILFS